MRKFRAADMEWEEGQGYRKRRIAMDGALPRQVDLLQEVRFRKGDTVPPHYHRTQTEMFFVLASGSITIDGIRVDAAPGDVIVCEPGEVHGMPLVEEDFAFLVLKVDYREDDTVWL
jgi:quercetin dioxygenase-like cupin family protein